jgi:coiled-coil domain-containing protein 12
MGGDGKPKVVFRNYRPKDKSLLQAEREELPPPPSSSSSGRREREAAVAEEPLPSAEDLLLAEAEGGGEGDGGAPIEETLLQRELRITKEEAGGEGVVNIAAQKANWDLKRDVAKKMKKLERRTQRAIVELLREKMAQEGSSGDDDEEGSSADDQA